ncbi:hypothetical protein [Gemmata sp.]|uniref:hypothetical protein n=1 Tax=Gemmata sp. TaxID=1914242 RepID=UPI003F70096D
MFTGHVRRSGSLRSVWHRRERKRRPAHELPLPPPPAVRLRPLPTELHWLCGCPSTMLRCVVRLATDPRTVFHLTPPDVERKLRLYYCACARTRWDAPSDDARHAVATVECRADGGTDREGWVRARRFAHAALQAVTRVWWAPEEQRPTVFLDALVAAAVRAHRGLGDRFAPPVYLVNTADQVALLNEVFGNPFAPVAVRSAWATRTVVDLSQLIATDRAFELMPVLGDALQDAGCDSAAVLDHCYRPAAHARGCWLLDALLGDG